MYYGYMNDIHIHIAHSAHRRKRRVLLYNYVMHIYILMLDVLMIIDLNCVQVHDSNSYSGDIIALRSSYLFALIRSDK